MAQENWYALPQDINQWQTVVLSNLSRKVPEIVRFIAGIDFSKIDPVVGSADGLVFLLGGMAAIPITIRSNKLAPLDVLVDKKENFYPVNETFLQKIYADNIIGEPSNDPVNNEDFGTDGPGQQVKYYNTVGAESRLKTASFEAKANLLGHIEKSAKLLMFFNEHRPEVLEVLYNSTPDEPTKIASCEEELPELMFLLKDDRGYSFNGERVSVGDAASFMKIAGLSDEQKAGVMNGGHICLDYREKHASVGFEGSDSSQWSDNPDQASSYIATVLDVDSVPHKGFLHREGIYKHVNNNNSHSYEFVFIGDTFYSVQDDVKIVHRVPVEIKHIKEVSAPTEPEVGMFGVVMSDYSISKPMTVNSVQKFGNVTIIRSLGFGMESEEFELGKGRAFYVVPEDRKSLLRNSDSSMLSTTGFNYTVGIDGDGNIVLDNKADSQANSVYSLMSKFAMDYEDATKIAEEAVSKGRVMFKVAAPAKAEKQKAEKNVQAQDTQGTTPTGQTPQMPVTQSDLEDVAAMNDPSLMDAYITGRLTDVNTAGREQLMQASDAILGAIKAVGRILFLVRVGKLDYIKEEDAQLCLNKLSDVARSIGIASSQLI